MALSRINGTDELFVGSVFAFSRPSALQEEKITHILSAIRYSLDGREELKGKYTHVSIDIDDVEEEDLLVHLSKCVRFIERGLQPESPLLSRAPRSGDASASGTAEDNADVITQAPEGEVREPRPPGAVFVHCAMGKSRSVAIVVAYLLWKYPHRFGASEMRNPDTTETAREAVRRALKWVRNTRPGAEPNPGFMQQLEMWWTMGCPADSDDAVERHVAYQRWLYKREVKESAEIGRAPDRLRFEDEETGEGGATGTSLPGREAPTDGSSVELRCKKCRRVLATTPFIVPHSTGGTEQGPCPHYFIEPLSWMRAILEEGELDGRLVCPNNRCGSSVGRYAWQGFKCSCREWVCPAFSLQRSKVDLVTIRPKTGAGGGPDPRTALGIRLPPGAAASRQENL